MNLQAVEEAIKTISGAFADRRVHLFAVEIDGLEDNRLALSGRVLEDSNRRLLLEELSGRFPGLDIDASGVQVARTSTTRKAWVGTNLSSLHDGTSFLAEQISQLLNGWELEILWDQDRWSFVRQSDGYLGWTYRPYLTETLPLLPTHLVIAPVGLLRESPQPGSSLVTRVLGGTAVYADEQGDWARVDLAGGSSGWLPCESLRPLAALPADPAARRSLVVADAFTMIGVPYLWGGCSAHGIDCSGFAQLLHRWVGLTLPRDADMQCAAGKPVEPPFAPGDLLFFGEKGEKRRITHVGISLGGWQMIHSSRSRNGVQTDDVQAVEHLRDSFLCAATFIGK